MMKHLSKFIVFLCLFFLVFSRLFGQHVQLFEGIVTDETGRPQQKIVVVLTDSLAHQWQAGTDATGYFAFAAMQVGRKYRLSFSRRGYFPM
ncbi:MAG TPA: carboxypeptidase-like regulatory domain-containing protein, partial [Arachidicoccus sp.]